MIRDEYVIRKNEVKSKRFDEIAKQLGFEVEETAFEYILRGGNDTMYRKLQSFTDSSCNDIFEKKVTYNKSKIDNINSFKQSCKELNVKIVNETSDTITVYGTPNDVNALEFNEVNWEDSKVKDSIAVTFDNHNTFNSYVEAKKDLKDYMLKKHLDRYYILFDENDKNFINSFMSRDVDSNLFNAVMKKDNVKTPDGDVYPYVVILTLKRTHDSITKIINVAKIARKQIHDGNVREAVDLVARLVRYGNTTAEIIQGMKENRPNLSIDELKLALEEGFKKAGVKNFAISKKELMDSKVKDYKESDIGRLLGKYAAKHNAILKYKVSNGNAIAYFKPKSNVKSYEFATALANDLAPTWISGGWDNDYFWLFNDKLTWTKDSKIKDFSVHKGDWFILYADDNKLYKVIDDRYMTTNGFSPNMIVEVYNIKRDFGKRHYEIIKQGRETFDPNRFDFSHATKFNSADEALKWLNRKLQLSNTDAKVKDKYTLKKAYNYDIKESDWNAFKKYCEQNNIKILSTDDVDVFTNDINHMKKIADILKVNLSKWTRLNDSKLKDDTFFTYRGIKVFKTNYGWKFIINHKQYEVATDEEAKEKIDSLLD